ncbi:MAG: cysteine dioxygenase type [Chloroflexi bacterium]|nr:cysteine dioxygenase type [Chloroflexota bacterium]
MGQFVSIDEVVAHLVELEKAGFATREVQAYLLGTRIDPKSIKPYVSFDRTHYTRNLIHRTNGFELLAICWDVGQAAPIHDHENEHCWARVEHGRLAFTNFTMVSDDPLRLEQVGRSVMGDPGHLDALPGIHKVANDRSFGHRAISLHLYARPFAECTIYDLTLGEKRRQRLRYDTVPVSMGI